AEAPQRLSILAFEFGTVMGGGVELQARLGGEKIEFTPLGRDRCRVVQLVTRAFQAEIVVKAALVVENLFEQGRLAEIVRRAGDEAHRPGGDEIAVGRRARL